jgi:GT2 family glycosyltransferase
MTAPAISIIIPVHNAERTLIRCLEDLHRSEGGASFECIVVDDGSSDSSGSIARGFGATVLRTGDRRGPACARNLGAASARAEILMFIDADVCVHPDTIERIHQSFIKDPALDAIIGSYDDSPLSPDFISVYRNLMHCFIHQTARREASTFWTGCGAIRRSVYQEHRLDEKFRRPSIEDIELGYRLRKAGRKLRLDPEIQVKHLKKWTLLGLLTTDVLSRGIPWTELILKHGSMPNDLNVQSSQRISVALVFLLLATAIGAAALYHDAFAIPVLALLLMALGRYWTDTPPARSPVAAIVAGVSAVTIAWRAWSHGMPGLVPPVLLVYPLHILRRYAEPTVRKYIGALLFLLAGFGSGLAVMYYLPRRPLVFFFFAILLLLVALNSSFYLFLASRRGKLFAVAAVPFHFLYHFYSGISFLAGLLRYLWYTFVLRKVS